MKSCLIITTLCFILGMWSFAFGADNEDVRIYYLRGEDRLRKGVTNLREFKQELNKGFASWNLKVGDMRKEFDQNRVRLSLFFRSIQKISSFFLL